MSKKLTLQEAVAGIATKHVGTERARLVEKWSRSGLLRGLEGNRRENMAQLLENQAAQVLKESNSISTGGASGVSSGQLAGFTTIAFPIVRRVFGGLVANELVSIQPMNLPSGLIFYLDYTYGSNVGGNAGLGLSNAATEATYQRGQSLYTNPTGKGIQSGSLAAGGMYDLVNTGYTKVHTGSLTLNLIGAAVGAWNTVGDVWLTGSTIGTAASGTNARFLGFDSQVDVDLSSGILDAVFLHIPVSALTSVIPAANLNDVDQLAITALPTVNGAVTWGQAYQSGMSVYNLRRLNKRGTFSSGVFTVDPFNGSHIQVVLRLSDAGAVPAFGSATTHVSVTLADSLTVDSGTGSTLTIPSFETDFSSGATSPAIPEVDIKIETISLTATTRKLKAKWSPEMAQDLNAYHSMDAEVELTSILSEQIALEIDREILQDLVTQANAANLYWSRAPGKFVNKYTGQEQQLASALAIGPAFTGTVREWYETLVETIIDVANTIQRKTLRGSGNFVVVGPDVATILESSILFKPKFSIDGDGQVGAMTIGAESIGTVSNRFTVYKDPYFSRNKILVGYQGKNNMDCGYVYAPYVPLIVTPTIYRPDDFAPTKGVMTRYAKKMIRSDYFGTVTIMNMNII